MALEPFDLLDEVTGCPGCDRRDVHPDDLCGCDHDSGPMCERCCRVMHVVGKRGWVA